MKNALIIHGTDGYPKEGWFPWTKTQLEAAGYQTEVPQFPIGEAQTPENWHKKLAECQTVFGPETILIGHSFGAGFLLKALEQISACVKVAVFVAPPSGVRPIKYWDLDKPLFKDGFEWETIKKNAEHHVVFHSHDDPFISIGNGQQVAQELNAEFIAKNDAGHFNARAGYTEFPELIEKLQPYL